MDSNSSNPREYTKSFVPLESNPSILNPLMHHLGVSDALELTDVWSTDPSQLELIARPVLALILLLPTSEQYEQRRCSTNKMHGKAEGSPGEEPIWIRQTIDNACGFYALLHAVCNPPARAFIEPNSLLSKILASPADEREALLENSKELEEMYQEAAERGQTSPPQAEDPVDMHFICFIRFHDQFVYELDSDAKGPVKTNIELKDNQDMLDERVLRHVQDWMAKETTLSFCLLALIDNSLM